MKLSGIATAFGLLTMAAGFAHAQSADQGNQGDNSVVPHRPSFDGGPVTEKDILREEERPINRLKPAPEETKNILVRFGQYVRIHFARPIKSVRIADKFTVMAVPETDHIIRFTGLSPGETSMTIEDQDGTETEWGLVTATSDPHLVRIYKPVRVNKHTGELAQESTGNAGYVAIECNEVHCEPIKTPAPSEADE